MRFYGQIIERTHIAGDVCSRIVPLLAELRSGRVLLSGRRRAILFKRGQFAFAKRLTLEKADFQLQFENHVLVAVFQLNVS